MTKDSLSEIVAHKRQVVARLRDDPSMIGIHEHAREIRKNAVPHRLLQALGADSPDLKIIAEFKRRSPSLGNIGATLSAGDAARCYDRGGACAISVLTDEKYFGGTIADLCAVRCNTNLPVLRKDFIIDPIQIHEAAIAGADAVLLIVAAMDDSSLVRLYKVAEEDLRLDAIVEVHTPDELARAMDAGAKIIGVNNRDLGTFAVSLETSERLIAEAPPDCVMISESGLQNAESLLRLRNLGFRGFLIGETLMRAADPEAALRSLTAAGKHRQNAPTVFRG